MLKVYSWDEVSGEWTATELDLPEQCRDSRRIALAFDRKMEIPAGAWNVIAHRITNGHLHIELRGERNLVAKLTTDPAYATYLADAEVGNDDRR